MLPKDVERKQKISVLKRISVVVISGEIIEIPDTGIGGLWSQVNRKNRIAGFMNLANKFLVAGYQVKLDKRGSRLAICSK